MDEIRKKAHQYFSDSVAKKNINNFKEALELIEKAINITPEVSLYWCTKAQYQFDLGRFSYALVSVEKAIELKPRNFIAWGIKGLIKRNMGECRQAAEAFIESLKIKPDFNVYSLLSAVQLEFDSKAALQSAKKALELNPEWEEAQNLFKKAEKQIERDSPQVE